MVSLLWSIIALSSGVLVFCVMPILGNLLDVDRRQRVGRFYSGLAMKSYGQLAFVDRVLGGYDMLPIGVDDERKMAEVTVDSGMISDDKKLPFKDPDDRIKRLHDKPVAVLIEDIPAAIDAELAELGYWVREHSLDNGLEQHAANGQIQVDPYVEMDNTLRVANPRDAFALVGKSVEPETIETAKQLTKKRFSEYSGNIGAAEMTATFMGFAVGAGGMAVLSYLRQGILSDGGGGGAPSSPIPLMLDVASVPLQSGLDVVMVIL